MNPANGAKLHFACVRCSRLPELADEESKSLKVFQGAKAVRGFMRPAAALKRNKEAREQPCV